MRWTCRCGEQTTDILDHIRLMHPEAEPVETWPDGKPVVVDLTDVEELK
jgi:hypothetical protein